MLDLPKIFGAKTGVFCPKNGPGDLKTATKREKISYFQNLYSTIVKDHQMDTCTKFGGSRVFLWLVVTIFNKNQEANLKFLGPY